MAERKSYTPEEIEAKKVRIQKHKQICGKSIVSQFEQSLDAVEQGKSVSRDSRPFKADAELEEIMDLMTQIFTGHESKQALHEAEGERKMQPHYWDNYYGASKYADFRDKKDIRAESENESRELKPEQTESALSQISLF